MWGTLIFVHVWLFLASSINSDESFYVPLSEDWGLPGESVIPLNPKDADPSIIIPCPRGVSINDCRWTFRGWNRTGIRTDMDDMYSFYMPKAMFGPRITCPDPLLISDYFSNSTDKKFYFKYFVFDKNYLIHVCFDKMSNKEKDQNGPFEGDDFPCEYINLDENKESSVEMPLPPDANFIRITATFKDRRLCGNGKILQIYDINVIDEKKPKINLDEIFSLKNLTKNISQYSKVNEDKCISDPDQELSYASGSLNGFFAHPIPQWVLIRGEELNQFEILYKNYPTLHFPNSHLLAAQLKAHRKSVALVSNPIPGLDTPPGQKLPYLLVSFWSTKNVDLTLCVHDHATNDVISCDSQQEYYYSNSFYSRRKFILHHGIEKTFELRLNIATKEQMGFFILDRINVRANLGRHAKDCTTETNLNTIEKMNDAKRVLPCPGSIVDVRQCRWFAPKRLGSKTDKFAFLFFNNGTYDNCSANPFVYSSFFGAAPERSLSFEYLSTGIDFMLEVCFARAQSLSFDKEKYTELPCTRFLIQENEVDVQQKARVPIPPEANRVYIVIMSFASSKCKNSLISLNDINID